MKDFDANKGLLIDTSMHTKSNSLGKFGFSAINCLSWKCMVMHIKISIILSPSIQFNDQ